MEQQQINRRDLIKTAKVSVAGDMGLLAMDESNPTCNERFARLGIPQTEAFRSAWRALILSTPNLGECIGGVILYDERIRQHTKDRSSFIKVFADAGIIPGIVTLPDFIGLPFNAGNSSLPLISITGRSTVLF